jgi:2-polyprenyl-6-methoxyphenol hydroxylase-like FAD-dependent oxidoreductase
MTPRIAQGANLAFEDGLELALQLSSASDLRFSFITDLLVCGKAGGFIF